MTAPIRRGTARRLSLRQPEPRRGPASVEDYIAAWDRTWRQAFVQLGMASQIIARKDNRL